MARRSSKRTTSRAASTRSASTRRSAAAAQPEEEQGGLGIEGGIAIATTVVLLVACLMVDYHLGTNYGEGLFFK